MNACFKLLISLLLIFSADISYSAEPGWIKDKTNNCEVWNPNPQEGETISYQGTCKNEKAHGYGEVTWYKKGKKGSTDKRYFYNGFWSDISSKSKMKIYFDLWEKENIEIMRVETKKSFIYKSGIDKDTGIIFYEFANKHPFPWSPKVSDRYAVVNKENVNILLDEKIVKNIAKTAANSQREYSKKLWTAIENPLRPTYDMNTLFVSESFIKGGKYKVYAKCRVQSPLSGDIGGRGIRCYNYYLDEYNKKLAKEKKDAIRLAKESAAGKVRHDFEKKYKVTDWPSCKKLTLNPFVFENNVVALQAKLDRMQSATTGLFEFLSSSCDDRLVVSGMPRGIITNNNKIIIAGKVLGNTKIKNALGGEIHVPELKFIGVYECQEFNCSDILGGN